VRRVVRGVALISFTVEGIVAAAVGLRLWLGYDLPAGRAAYHGLFHGISAFNNAGFALYSDNLIGYATDPLVCLPLAAAVIVGGLGFPVIFELRRELGTPRRWSIHTKTTLLATSVLLFVGTAVFLAFEWTNPATLGPLGASGKLLVGLFNGGVQPRTAGFNSIDYGQAHETSLLVTDVLMFIGGGSAGTAGGIKVTTFTVLLFAIISEVRGEATVDAFGRQLSPGVVRQALSVALLGVALVVSGTLALLALSGLDLDRVLFETVSAFGTVGLSTGITAVLPAPAQYVLIGLMFAGRIGPITLASALALREKRKLYRLPEERPIVG
jgi:trk system potassium uptake protein